MKEGVACYQDYLRAPARPHRQPRRHGRSCRRRRCVRIDGDDPYLVVAADKGTATFSDYANAISAEYGHWLGDAFASGGSAGYDHKAHGHHGARRLGKRQAASSASSASTRRATDFTVVGVGDMSGDVFGNGMLLSRHIRLVAAFDHRHVFIDPNPDAASVVRRARAPVQAAALVVGRLRHQADLRRRRRLGALGEVDPAVAAGARGARHRAPSRLAPTELLSAILKAPVDLLYNGGIGTYVKAAQRDPRRGRRPRQRCAAHRRRASCAARWSPKAATWACTQRGRIEAALAGVQHQHRRDRQLGRRRHLGPRGQHQDPARPGDRRRRDDREAAQHAAAADDRRRGRAGAARQLLPDPGAVDRRAGSAARLLDQAGALHPLPGEERRS